MGTYEFLRTHFLASAASTLSLSLSRIVFSLTVWFKKILSCWVSKRLGPRSSVVHLPLFHSNSLRETDRACNWIRRWLSFISVDLRRQISLSSTSAARSAYTGCCLSDCFVTPSARRRIVARCGSFSFGCEHMCFPCLPLLMCVGWRQRSSLLCMHARHWS